MKTAAVICEYNPFHNGHKYQIDKARSETGCDAVVALMSGNFVQRGSFAIFDKFVRMDAAISCGVDLVLENPAVFVLRSAEGYASAAVKTLSSLGCIDYLFFGAEYDNLNYLYELSNFFAYESAEFKGALSKEMDRGVSFPKARSNAAASILGKEAEEILKQPNNLLAIEYIKAIIIQKSELKPVLIKRVNVDHNSVVPNGGFASASYIRGEINHNMDRVSELVPDYAWNIYLKALAFESDEAGRAVMAALSLMPKEKLAATPDISEGLENKIKQTVMKCNSLEEVLDSIKSKRYAYSRLRRAVLCAYLGITDEDAKLSPKYIKTLGFNDMGQKVLNIAKKTATLPLAKSAAPILKNDIAMSLWRRELEFDKVYEILSKSGSSYGETVGKAD